MRGARNPGFVERLAVAAIATALTGSMLCAQALPSAPPAVRKAFAQAYPGATISRVVQEREHGKTVVRIESIDRGRRRVLLYDPNGAVIEVAEQLEEKDLPKPVAAAMRSHPRAIYGSGMKVTRGGSVTYHLTLRGTRKTAMVAKPDGTVLSFK
jgi:hypothetical protein